MKIEVLFVGASVDMETYEGDLVTWVSHEGYLHIWEGEDEKAKKVASYPENRVVRVRIV